jgi:ABC-2 type transport system ATP-binding protein
VTPAQATAAPAPERATPRRVDDPLVAAVALERAFAGRPALAGVSFAVAAGGIHALLGPNGAGKTTLLRILSGLLKPDAGTISVRGAVGLVPSGDRSFYLRISALENMLFFARLHGLGRREGKARATAALEAVELGAVARQPVGELSHGMQKRLSFARALLAEPRVVLVDEATHDLDPRAARTVLELTRGLAAGGAAVVWATQRIEEIRGFADDVTLLREGSVRFSGSVAELSGRVRVRRHVVRLRRHGDGAAPPLLALRHHLDGIAAVERTADDDELHVLDLLGDSSLGDAFAALGAGGIDVLSCREARSELEEAFVELTEPVA